MLLERENKVINLDDFTLKNEKVKSPIMEIVAILARAVNKHKFNYHQIRFILKSVRERCEIAYPKKQHKLPRIPSKEDVEAFFKVIQDPVHKLIFEMLIGTGLRVGELAKLKVSDIDFGANTIFVSQGKGGKDRQAVLGNKLKAKLQLYLANRNNTYLFESNRHNKLSKRRIQQLCTQYASTANVLHVHCHSLRHRYITKLADNNISREAREIVVGHAKGSKAHDVYVHLSTAGVKDQIINVLDKE